ncbi:hypothetical protein DERP_011746 [Dermatophagoides pteronyssinus]|uniref:Uncharacterized protein n=1 Tax=Dermatophagoides pteronyssinus TaxID=6956 RepID=A0ABQ8J3D3_DERPT|nr:hypothetical protein DERP_011746 [Dermatophagoides pteronyssinus]
MTGVVDIEVLFDAYDDKLAGVTIGVNICTACGCCLILLLLVAITFAGIVKAFDTEAVTVAIILVAVVELPNVEIFGVTNVPGVVVAELVANTILGPIRLDICPLLVNIFVLPAGTNRLIDDRWYRDDPTIPTLPVLTSISIFNNNFA